MKKQGNAAQPKKSGTRGKNYGHHSGLHGDARIARTLANKARRAARRQRLALKRTLNRASVNRRIRWLTRYAANLRRRIEDGHDYTFRLREIEAELARETL